MTRVGCMRAFVALPLADPLLEELAAAIDRMRVQPCAHHIGWQRPANLHLTLRFLGEIRSADLTRLRAALPAALSLVPAFELRLCGLELFPSARRPRIVAARVAGGDPLAALARAVEAVVVACGFPPDPRGLRPHVTLGRIREGGADARAPDPSLAGEIASRAMTVTRVVLYRSRLLAGGSEYSELLTCELATA